MTNYAGYTEKMLLQLTAAGDRQAFSELYKEYLHQLYRFVYLFTKSKEETDEIIQEVFVNIWEKKEKLTGVESFRNYVYTAAKNRVLSNVRHLQVRHKVFTEIRRTKEQAGENTANDVAYREYYRVVKEAIDKLPPRRQLIFRMNIENGLSLDEISEKLGISKNVVKKQLYTALEFVRHYLTKYGEISYIVLLVAMAGAQ